MLVGFRQRGQLRLRGSSQIRSRSGRLRLNGNSQGRNSSDDKQSHHHLQQPPEIMQESSRQPTTFTPGNFQGTVASQLSYCIPIEVGVECSYWRTIEARREKAMGDKTDVWQGTLSLMVLRTLETMGAQHGYGLARRIEQTSGDLLQLNYGTLYPALLKLEQEGFIRSRWGLSENNRKAKFYELTKAGHRQLKKAAADWEQTTAILARFLAPTGEA